MFKRLLLLCLIHFLNSLKSKNEFCFRNLKVVCTGMYDKLSLKYTEKCKELTCKKHRYHLNAKITALIKKQIVNF